MRILVTGSSGLIGSALVRLLVHRGHQVLGIDNLMLGQEHPAPMYQYRFVQADICDESIVGQLVGDFEPDAIAHLAAVHHIPTCERDPVSTYSTNIVGTQRVLDAAAAVACPRVVSASSGAVYDWVEGPLDPVHSPVLPRDTYSISKYANELQLRHWQAIHGGTAISARIFNTIGEHDRNGHLIPNVISQVLPGRRRIELKVGNLGTRRDYVYVTDTAAAIAEMLTCTLDTAYLTLNVGTGKEVSVREVIEIIGRLLGVQFALVRDEARVRRFDRESQVARMDATYSLLCWRPQVNLTEGLRRTIGLDS